MPIIIARIFYNFEFIDNIVERTSGTKGFLFFLNELSEYHHTIYKNTFKNNAGFIHSGVLNILSLRDS